MTNTMILTDRPTSARPRDECRPKVDLVADIEKSVDGDAARYMHAGNVFVHTPIRD